jgi:uncharacterized protein (TIGR02145 family)
MKNKRLKVSAILLLCIGLSGAMAQTVTDIDGNVYETVTIGKQVWMKENLKVTRYRNGDAIGTTTPATMDINSENTPKYQWAYEGNDSNVATYGRLYTWYAITDSRDVCPIGWHVSTDAEWTMLLNYLGEPSTVGEKLRETGTVHWKSPDEDATNETGFSALPAGSRWANGKFAQMGECTHLWTATEFDSNNAWRRLLFEIEKGWSSKKNGWPVRCIKD